MGEQYKLLISLIIAIIFLVSHILTYNRVEEKPKEFNGIGRITRINQNDLGDSWFYVDIVIDGVVHSAKTDSYVLKPEDLEIGNEVNVVYRYTKNGNIRCYINDVGFKRVIEDDVSKKTPVLLFISLAFFALSVLIFLKSIISFK